MSVEGISGQKIWFKSVASAVTHNGIKGSK